MTTSKALALAAVLVPLVVVGTASAAPRDVVIGRPGVSPPGLGACPPGLAKKNRCVKAPEIDASAGVQAIALLGGIMLLVGERARRRKA